MRLYLDRLRSPIGVILLVWDDEERVRALDFEDGEARMRRLLGRYCACGSDALEHGKAPVRIADSIDAFFGGELDALARVDVAAQGTAFQRAVWTALRRVHAGSTITYSELAIHAGRPGASRAVGAANGSNPAALVVPCHRVIGANGSLTGYAGGLARKKWLLEHEAAAQLNRTPLFTV